MVTPSDLSLPLGALCYLRLNVFSLDPYNGVAFDSGLLGKFVLNRLLLHMVFITSARKSFICLLLDSTNHAKKIANICFAVMFTWCPCLPLSVRRHIEPKRSNPRRTSKCRISQPYHLLSTSYASSMKTQNLKSKNA